jgi:bifunctional non-homologous end joining protein LigD
MTPRLRLLAKAIAALRSRPCIIDGEAVAVGPDGIPSFDRLRYRRRDASVILFAFDLIELNGEDLRRTPLEQRKTALTKLLSRAGPRIQFNEHIEEEGALVFEHAYKLGLEGIVSKRKGSTYSSGRSRLWSLGHSG